MKKKTTKPKKSFANRLAENLIQSEMGKVDTGVLGDQSGSWVSIKIKDVTLSFEFDGKGKQIDRIGLYQDQWEITGQNQIWEVNKRINNTK